MNDDFISRQAAIELAKDIVFPYEDGSEYRHRCIDPMQIYELPAVDARENIKGEWRTTYLDHVVMGERPKILYCSVCNQCIAYPTNYCPNCGAEMRGGDAE